jgi:hypothetical protein
LRNKQDFEKLKDSVRSNGDNYHSNGVKNANFVLDSSDIENGSFLFDIHHSRNAILI